MCIIVRYNGQALDTVEELHAAIGRPAEMIPDFATRGSPLHPGECLCWVDIIATAKVVGKVAHPLFDGCDWAIVDA